MIVASLKILWRNLCWVWKKKTNNIGYLLSNWPQLLKIFYDWHIWYYFWWFRYM